jgi:heterodisulfide reductase subunit B
MLRTEGLQWEGRSTVSHLLTVLHRDVGVDALRAAVVNPLESLKVAIHTGCHALRPGNVTRYDNPLTPSIFNDLVDVTGAESVFWSMSDDCCGNPQWEKNRKLALKQMQRKMLNAKQSGADFVCTACTYCQMQFEQKNQSELIAQDSGTTIPAVLISQLIGLSIGMKESEIGLTDENRQNLLANAGVS